MRKVAYYLLGAVLALLPIPLYIALIAILANSALAFNHQLIVLMFLAILFTAYYQWMFDND